MLAPFASSFNTIQEQTKFCLARYKQPKQAKTQCSVDMWIVLYLALGLELLASHCCHKDGHPFGNELINGYYSASKSNSIKCTPDYSCNNVKSNSVPASADLPLHPPA